MGWSPELDKKKDGGSQRSNGISLSLLPDCGRSVTSHSGCHALPDTTGYVLNHEPHSNSFFLELFSSGILPQREED